jgi:hypothetical protein
VWLRRGVDHPLTSNDKVKERTELYPAHPLLCFHRTLEDEVYFTSLLELLALFHKISTKPSKIRYMEYFDSLGLYIKKFKNEKRQGDVKLYSLVQGAQLDSRCG